MRLRDRAGRRAGRATRRPARKEVTRGPTRLGGRPGCCPCADPPGYGTLVGVTEAAEATDSRAARGRLIELVRELAVVHGRVVLASGREADYYIDARVPTLHHESAPLIGRLMRELTADWEFDAVGGLTMGADPVAIAMMHAPGPPLDAFVVRKAAKDHGMARQIEGPSVSGHRVLAVEDTSTTGGSVLQAVDSLVAAAPRWSEWRR